MMGSEFFHTLVLSILVAGFSVKIINDDKL